MIWVKCMFAGVDKVNECYAELKKLFNGHEHIRLLQLENKLRGETESSCFVLRVGIQDTLA